MCVIKPCPEGERELEIYNKKIRIRKVKNKGRRIEKERYYGG